MPLSGFSLTLKPNFSFASIELTIGSNISNLILKCLSSFMRSTIFEFLMSGQFSLNDKPNNRIFDLLKLRSFSETYKLFSQGKILSTSNDGQDWF